ncbi:hypothetical protein L1887_23491 [Cichorium endivia]|nr:hypothetical protein L1887_23491 [Cichorium endivia]
MDMLLFILVSTCISLFSDLCLILFVNKPFAFAFGARIVISHPKGREMLKQQKVEYPEIVVSDLPDKVTLESVAFDHSFTMLQFIDEPGFYLALLTHKT